MYKHSNTKTNSYSWNVELRRIPVTSVVQIHCSHFFFYFSPNCPKVSGFQFGKAPVQKNTHHPLPQPVSPVSSPTGRRLRPEIKHMEVSMWDTMGYPKSFKSWSPGWENFRVETTMGYPTGDDSRKHQKNLGVLGGEEGNLHPLNNRSQHMVIAKLKRRWCTETW